MQTYMHAEPDEPESPLPESPDVVVVVVVAVPVVGGGDHDGATAQIH